MEENSLNNNEINNQTIEESTTPVNDILNVANENEPEVKEETPVTPVEQTELTNDIETVAEENKVQFKQAPNVDLGNAPVVEEEPKEVEEVDDSNIPSFNDTAQTIGTIKPDKQKSPLAMVVLFSILILFILFMPEAIKKFNEYFGTDLVVQDGIYIQDDDINSNDNNTNKTNTDTNNSNSNTNTTNNLKVSKIDDSLSITIDSIVLSNFKKGEENNQYYIDLTIKNNKTTTYTFVKKLYLDFYNDNDVFIDRVLLNVNTIEASSSVTVRGYITNEIYSTGTKVSAVLRGEDDYPSVTLASNILNCTKEARTLKYTFASNKLIKIEDTNKYIKSSDLTEYTTMLMNRKNTISSMDAVDGVTAVLTEDETGYMTSIIIDYNTAIYSNLVSKVDYYDKDTNAKVISFELQAKGYICN